MTPPETLGATPLADVRRVYAELDPAVRDEFERRGWRLVRNFHDDFGTTWQHVFNTEDRDEVAEYCANNGIEIEWRGKNGLRTTAVREAVHLRPGSDVPRWFNHATFFHVTHAARRTCRRAWSRCSARTACRPTPTTATASRSPPR